MVSEHDAVVVLDKLDVKDEGASAHTNIDTVSIAVTSAAVTSAAVTSAAVTSEAVTSTSAAVVIVAVSVNLCRTVKHLILNYHRN